MQTGGGFTVPLEGRFKSRESLFPAAAASVSRWGRGKAVSRLLTNAALMAMGPGGGGGVWGDGEDGDAQPWKDWGDPAGAAPAPRGPRRLRGGFSLRQRCPRQHKRTK